MKDDQNNGGLWSSVTSWLRQPFDTRGSALNWVLWTGLLIGAVFFWNVILLEITEEL